MKRYKDANRIYIVIYQLVLRPGSEFAKHPDKYKIRIIEKYRLINTFGFDYTLLGKNLLTLEDSIREYRKFISKIKSEHRGSFIYFHN